MFDSVLKLSILVNLQSHVLCKNLRFAQITQKNPQKYGALCAKDAQNFTKKYLRENYANFAQKLQICGDISRVKNEIHSLAF